MSITRKTYVTLISTLCVCFSTSFAHDIPTPIQTMNDDSEVIVNRLKDSMNAYGLISVEQGSGHLLFNPLIEKLQNMPLKQKFLLPAMIVNQKEGLKIVEELPFSCFLISGTELATENYKGFKQYETARYIRDVKNFNVNRVLLCQAVGLAGARSWGKNLNLDLDDDPFIFEQFKSLTGDNFYYFLNTDGLFEMYL